MTRTRLTIAKLLSLALAYVYGGRLRGIKIVWDAD